MLKKLLTPLMVVQGGLCFFCKKSAITEGIDAIRE